MWTVEANKDAERYITSNAYILDICGRTQRNITKDFILAEYNLTKTNEIPVQLKTDVNKVEPKYRIA